MPRNIKQKRQFHFLYSSLTVRLKLRCTSSPIGSHFLQKVDINCPSSAWESHCFHLKLKQGCVFHHPLAKARNVAVRNVTAVITSRESTTCTPAPPRDVWALSNPAIRSHTHTLTSLFAILFLSLSNSHTLFSKPICPWGAYAMQRSNTNFTACARYNLIFCAREMEEWAKKKKSPHKQTTQVFVTTARWKFPHHALSIWFDFIEGAAVQILNPCMPHLFFFYIGYSHKKKQTHRRWLDLPLQRFSECNHLRIQTARLPAEEQHFHFFPLCKWDACYE